MTLIHNMNRVWQMILLVIIIATGASLYFYDNMPDQMASHWNTKGEVDGYMSKFWGSFMMPLLLIGMAVLFAIIPKIDPLKKNIEKFRKHFDLFILMIFLFMLVLHMITLAVNRGADINFNIIMPVATGLLFYYIGNLCQHAKRNWFIGIRTPWTLSSDKVWDKTHKLASKLYKASGIITVSGILFGNLAMWFVLIPVISTSIILVVYSYIEFRKINVEV